MSRLLRCSFPVFLLGCTLSLTLGAQPPSGPSPGQAVPNGPARGPQKPRNLKVLPQDTDLRKVMHGYTVDLGVECTFCHAVPDPVTHRPDFASDANPTKEIARYMIQMTDDLNTKYLDQMPNRSYADPVTCGTCHRGEKHPSVFAATPHPDGTRPPGMPPAAATAPAGSPGK